MIRATWTVGNVQRHALTLQEMTSQLLNGLAAGKYDREAAFGERVLTEIGVALPPAMMVKQALEVFLEIWRRRLRRVFQPHIEDLIYLQNMQQII